MDTFSAHRQNNDTLELGAPHTAVLVVDMVNDFCEPGGAMVLPDTERLYAPQNNLISALREAGGSVIFVVDCHRSGMRRDREFIKRDVHCMENTTGSEVVKALDRKADDITVIKRRYSGFFGTDLDLTLRDMQIDTVVVIGVVTNICVRSTVHDAFFLGYRVVVPQDCVAATGPREQLSSLYDIATHFGWVTNSNEVINAIERGDIIHNTDIPG